MIIFQMFFVLTYTYIVTAMKGLYCGIYTDVGPET